MVAVVANEPPPWSSSPLLLVNCPTTPTTGTQTNPAFVVEESAHAYQGQVGQGQGKGIHPQRQMRQQAAISSAAKCAMQQKGGLGRRGRRRRCCKHVKDSKQCHPISKLFLDGNPCAVVIKFELITKKC
jgi:hypothetical protein